MVNKGLEFTLNVKVIENEGDGFNWELGGNFSTLKNEVTKLYGESDIITGYRPLFCRTVLQKFVWKGS